MREYGRRQGRIKREGGGGVIEQGADTSRHPNP